MTTSISMRERTGIINPFLEKCCMFGSETEVTSLTQGQRNIRSAAMLAANGRFLLNMFPLFAVSLGTRAEMPLMPSHRRALQTAVSTSAGLTSALANTATSHIVLAPGTYYLSAQAQLITGSVVIEAAVAGSVVLDAQASSSNPRNVLYIDPGSSDIVQLIGLNITGGYMVSVLQMVLMPAPPNR
jgi:hypothetical protein